MIKSLEKYIKDIEAISKYSVLIILWDDESIIVNSYIASDKKRKLESNKNERNKNFFELFSNIVVPPFTILDSFVDIIQ